MGVSEWGSWHSGSSRRSGGGVGMGAEVGEHFSRGLGAGESVGVAGPPGCPFGSGTDLDRNSVPNFLGQPVTSEPSTLIFQVLVQPPERRGCWHTVPQRSTAEEGKG